MNEVEEKIQQQVSNVADDLGIKTIKIESNQQSGYYFRITLKEEKIIRNKKHYTILDSNKSGVKFHNDKLKELNNDFLAVREKYLDEQKDVIEEIVKIAGLFKIYYLAKDCAININIFINLCDIQLITAKQYALLVVYWHALMFLLHLLLQQ